MPNEMTIFQGGALPAHIAQHPDAVSLNANAQHGVRITFPTVSIRGKLWRVKHRGTETVIQRSEGNDHSGNPLPVSPVRALNVVVVGVDPIISKSYFVGKFQEGVEAIPDCFSNDGEMPDPASSSKQSELCSTCQLNKFGSIKRDDGSEGGKACRDVRKIAVVPDGDVESRLYGGPLLMRLPATSISNLARYSNELALAGYDVTQVVTSMSFDVGFTHQVIKFEALGFVQSAADYSAVVRWAKSDIIRQMFEATPSLDAAGGPISPVMPTRDQYVEQNDPAELDYFPATETAALIQNAEYRLTHESDPNNWIVVLHDCAKACQSIAELTAVRAIDAVKEASVKAPVKFRRRMQEIWDEAIERLSPKGNGHDTAAAQWDGDTVNGTEPQRADPPVAMAMAVTAPTHTDLMVVPESIDAFIEKYPPPESAPFSAWLVDGEGNEMADADGVIEAHTDPVKFANAYLDALASEFPGTIELFRGANQEAVDLAKQISPEASALLSPKPPETAGNPTLPMDLPADPAFIVPPAKATTAEFAAYNGRLQAALELGTTQDWVSTVKARNSATIEAFPPKRRLDAKAVIEAREKVVTSIPARGEETPTFAKIAEGMLTDIAGLETEMEVDVYAKSTFRIAELERLREGKPALHAVVQRALTERLAAVTKSPPTPRQVADDMMVKLRGCDTSDAAMALVRGQEYIASAKQLSTASSELWKEVKATAASIAAQRPEVWAPVKAMYDAQAKPA